jgi:hypothetical protein
MKTIFLILLICVSSGILSQKFNLDLREEMSRTCFRKTTLDSVISYPDTLDLTDREGKFVFDFDNSTLTHYSTNENILKNKSVSIKFELDTLSDNVYRFINYLKHCWGDETLSYGFIIDLTPGVETVQQFFYDGFPDGRIETTINIFPTSKLVRIE